MTARLQDCKTANSTNSDPCRDSRRTAKLQNCRTAELSYSPLAANIDLIVRKMSFMSVRIDQFST